MELDDDSNQLCNINTHVIYECQHLSFGVKSAAYNLQEMMENMLAGLPFGTTNLDDIVLVSRSSDDHRHHLHAVFDRINEYGFPMRLRKCSFF